MFIMDAAVIALSRLIGDTTERRMEVADAIGFNEQTLYQITRGIKLKSGKTRTVGRKLREALDRCYPDWLDSTVDQIAAPKPCQLMPNLAQALEVIGSAMAMPMADDVRDDLAHALSNLAKRRGLQRDQMQVLALLQSAPEKRREMA